MLQGWQLLQTRQFDIAVCLDLPLFSFCVKSECYSENDRQCVGTSVFPCPPTSAILATYFCRRAVEMCRDLWREGERRCDFASLSQNCELSGFRTIVIPVFERQCAKSFLQRGWKEDGYATLRLLNYCKGEYKDVCKLQHLQVNKISCALRGQSVWDSLCSLPGLCVYDGFLPEQHDWEPVYVNRCIWDNFEWWGTNFLFWESWCVCTEICESCWSAVRLGGWGLAVRNGRVPEHDGVCNAFHPQTADVVCHSAWRKLCMSYSTVTYMY